MCCQVRDDMGGVWGVQQRKIPRRRCKVFLSMQTAVRFSCDQLTTKRLSSLILQPNEVSNFRLRLAKGITGSLEHEPGFQRPGVPSVCGGMCCRSSLHHLLSCLTLPATAVYYNHNNKRLEATLTRWRGQDKYHNHLH